jgi:hypothetical protein
MSDIPYFYVSNQTATRIERAFHSSPLKDVDWHTALPPVNSVQELFRKAIAEYHLRSTMLGHELNELSTRRSAKGWVVIEGLPRNVHPHFLLGLCSYLIGDISEVPDAGPYISQVKELPDAQLSRPSHANKLSFELHTDRSFLKEGRPEFQLLQSVYNPAGFGGLSEAANIDDAVAVLEPRCAKQVIRLLKAENFLFPAPPHTNPSGGDMIKGAILDNASLFSKKHYVRFRQDGLASLTSEASGAVNALVVALNKVKSQFLLEDGQILITDNWRVLHGRTAIEANPERPRELNKSYVDTDPHLQVYRFFSHILDCRF